MPPAPRDIYDNEVDFVALASQDPAFAKRLKANKQLDFSDPRSVLQLTKSLLQRDFDLDIELPDDRLCPPVPNRYGHSVYPPQWPPTFPLVKIRENHALDLLTRIARTRFSYILWLQDLLDSTSPDYRESYDPDRQVLAIDIGTGASCIYPLISCRQRPGFRFVATETDDRSFSYAALNVLRNGLGDKIEVLKVEDIGKDAPLVPEVILNRFEKIDIILTNPPFYASKHEMFISQAGKSRPPNSICTGSESEMITWGGEVGFITRLIRQSSSQQPNVKAKVQWWSSLVGKLSSVGVVVETLKKAGCVNWAVKEFGQGNKTRRWGVAWSWDGLRPASRVARGVKVKVLKAAAAAGVAATPAADAEKVDGGLLPFPAEFEFKLHGMGLDEVGIKIDALISDLDLHWQWKPALRTGLAVAADGDCWSRKARRRRWHRQQEQGQKQWGKEKSRREDADMQEIDTENEDGDDDKQPQLVTKIMISHPASEEREEEGQGMGGPRGTGVVMVRWLRGHDHVFFESFCGWFKRRIASVATESVDLSACHT